ncbi:hypothetical protein HDV00_003463 [Rhizophlyctis rosea]|nr:hypothetical protein HDV00_003463 [Rhizophlyctis rosea]
MSAPVLLEPHREMVTDLLSAATTLASSSDLPATAPRSQTRGDGLLILSKGLGLRHILLAFLQIHADPRNLVFLVNTPSREVEQLQEDLMTVTAARDPASNEGDRVHPGMLKIINNETPANDRAELYLLGGIIAVTSRILVVDMLNKVVPLQLVTGIMVNHAHRVSDASMEAFILRLFREQNKVGFIKAFSDEPEFFVNGFWKLERTMKLLFLRSVYLWPRFHVKVDAAIEKAGRADLVELRVPLTKSMKEIQASLVECMEQCLAELRRSNPTIDAEDFTVENAFFKSFDSMLRQQLDPIWHRIGQKSKQLVNDLKTLRKLLGYLVAYDCVTFNSFLETILTANSTDPTAVFRSEAAQSPWLLLDSAHTLFEVARQRVFRRKAGAAGSINDGVPPGIEPVLEEQPKWRVLQSVMREIEAERKHLTGNGEGSILIMVDGDRTCTQLREILSGMDTIKPETQEGPSIPNHSISRKRSRAASEVIDVDEASEKQSTGPTSLAKSNSGSATDVTFSTEGTGRLLRRLLRNYFRWKGGLSKVTKNLFRKGQLRKDNNRDGGHQTNAAAGRGRGQGRGGAPPNKRRRVRGGGGVSVNEASRDGNAGIGETGLPVSFEEEAAEVAAFLNQTEQRTESTNSTNGNGTWRKPSEEEFDPLSYSDYYGVIKALDLVTVRPYASSSNSIAGGSASNGDDDARALEELRPQWIVMYDPDVGFVRRVEIFKAQHPELRLKVYFMVYDNSIEEQRYLSQIRKEKGAFEKLIREKAVMAVPVDQDGRIQEDPDELFWRNLDTRVAGGQTIAAADANQVIVDVREFRSSLPSLLHARRMNLCPCTLEVGDYVLSPSLCVERKSVSDLIQSLKSGRLYTQCEAMSVHYKMPVLLIEFDRDKAFSLVTAGEVRGDISGWDVGSRLTLLVLSFPKLRIIWSSSPEATAEIFEDLKKNQEEPKMEEAMAVGVENVETVESAYSITPSNVLRSLPGINSKNYRLVMAKAESLREVSEWTLEQCQEVLGQEYGRMLHNFFRSDPKEDS